MGGKKNEGRRGEKGERREGRRKEARKGKEGEYLLWITFVFKLSGNIKVKVLF